MPRNCSCCNSPDHTVRTCDSQDMTLTIELFKRDIQRIFNHDTLTDLSYHFTRETASQMNAHFTALSVCRLQRAIQTITHDMTIKSLKHMVARMVPNVRRIPSAKYELVCTLMHHYMTHGEGQQHLVHENPILTRLYMDYLTRGLTMSYEANMALLEFEVSPIVVEQLEAIRANHVQNLVRRYEESTAEERLEFVYRGIRDIRYHSSGWRRHRLGAFPQPTVFGNVLYIDIITYFPLFRREIEQRIQLIELQQADQRAALVATMADIHRQQREAERPRPQSPQHPPPGWGGIPLHRLGRLDLPQRRPAAAAPRPNPVKYGVDLCFTSTEECPICYENVCDSYVDCKHAFCLGCIKRHVDTLNARRSTPICPMCRVDVKQVNSNEGQRRPEVVDLTV